MAKISVTGKIGGEAGFGIMASGTMLTKAGVSGGYSAIAGNEYPSLIRGGHNVVTVRLSRDVMYSLVDSVDLLIALNKETYDLHIDEVSSEGVVVYDPKDAILVKEGTSITHIPIPLSEIVAVAKGEAVMRNTVAIGAVMAIFGLDFSLLEEVIGNQFAKKGKEIILGNVAFAKAGFDHVKKNYMTLTHLYLEKPEIKKEQFVMNVSEAVAIGALDSGMKFAAIYPMTPINALIPMFSDKAKELGIIYKQPEDEIAGIMMAIGASLAGARSMVATSGGGFALMVEGVSLAGIMEVPIVINLGMRPGPATGMPTWTEQSELRMVLHAGHGEFPRVIVAPGDVEEAYRLTKQAFLMAEKYQTPVFILTDKYLNETQWSVPREVFSNPSVPPLSFALPASDDSFKRYAIGNTNGVSERSIPGMDHGMYIANSYEHDEKGFTTEEASMREKMAGKRYQKYVALCSEAPLPSVYGHDDAEITFVAFGSTKSPILEAMKLLEQKGKHAKLIHFSWVYPFNPDVSSMFSKEKRLIAVEGNSMGQLSGLIQEETGIHIKEKLLKNNGRQWMPEEILTQIHI